MKQASRSVLKKNAPTLRDAAPRAETAAQQAKFSQAVEQAGDIIFIANREGVIEYVNPAFESVTGYAKEEALGKTPRILQSGKMPQDYYRGLWKTILAGEIFRAEVIDRKKNGELFYYDQTISPLKDPLGRITHFISTGKEVTERKRAEQEIRLLLQLTRAIAEAEDLDSALVATLRILCESTDWDFGEIWFPSDDGKRLELGSPCYCKLKELEGFRSKSREFSFAPAIGLPGRAWVSGKAAWIQDVTVNGNFLRASIAGEAGLKAAVGVPILAGDTVVAVLAFFMREARQEDERMVALVSAAAAQLGAAFLRKRAQDEIAKLHSELEQSAAALEKRLQESNALAHISRSLGETERIGLQTVLQLIAASAKELIPATEQAVIHLWDEEGQILTAQAVIGFEDAASGKLKMRPNEGVAGQVIVSGETINIADVEKDERFIPYGAPQKFRSLMVAPVQSGRERLGTISVQSIQPGVFTSEEQRLLNALGTQAAIAIENAHLLESTQQALKETNALYRIIQGLAASLDPQELLQDAVELLKNNFGYYHVQVYIMEPATGDLLLRAGSGEIGRQLKERGHFLRAGMGIVGHAAETGAAFFTNNVEEAISFVRNPLLPDTRSELAVPVKTGNRILGVLDIQQTPPAALAQRDLQLVSAVADQLAVALHKASLYADLQAALAQEKATRSQLIQSERLALVGRLLATVSHELNNPLQAIQNALFLIKDEIAPSSQARQDMNIILAETERMAALIERLRMAYHPIRGEDFQPVQLNNIVEEVYALISTHMRHKEIAFEFFPDTGLPDVSGVSDHIRQVVFNLFLNAIEVMKPGGRLTVQTCGLLQQNEILLSVKDTGPGIGPEILPKIFDPFTTSKDTGTGLGLTITHDIIEQHRGRIAAENDPQGGAVFNVWLPVFEKG